MIGLVGVDTVVIPAFPLQCHTTKDPVSGAPSTVWVDGVIIVGAGPSGLAVAACLKEKGISSLVLEQADCIASLWQHRTYDRLHLHIAKQYCELPLLPFPPAVPLYPTRDEFLDYLHTYVERFKIHPVFDRCVVSAGYSSPSSPAGTGFWRVRTMSKSKEMKEEYLGRWLVVATGENAVERIPDDLHGLESFQGKVLHSSMYRNGKSFAGKGVLVVGAGNSGMEIALDLLNHGAEPSIIVRSRMHILPKEMFGMSTFAIAMNLMKLLPLALTDRLLLLYASVVLGSTSKYGICRPRMGPLETKAKLGKTPILDMGVFEKIREGSIKVLPAIQRVTSQGAHFVDGQYHPYDVILLATGYKSNVTKWLKDNEDEFSVDGYPKLRTSKFGRGLYVAGLSRQGILGGAKDAVAIAEDIQAICKSEERHFKLSTVARH